jgi:DNA-binding transcriptional LysR family regulator
MHAAPLFRESSVLVARRGHGAAGARISRRTLAELRHVRVEMVPGRNFRDPFAAAFARAGVPREVVMTVPSFTAAAEVVAATDLVTMLPASFLAAKGASLGLRAIASKTNVVPSRAIEIAMCWHERTHADAAARAFRALVRRVVVAEARGTRGTRRPSAD